MLNFPENQIRVKNKREREVLDRADEIWKKNFQGRLITSSQGIKVEIICPLTETIFPISQKHSAFSNLLYGRKGTIGEGGCGPLAVEYALRLMGLQTSLLEIIEQCDYKGYRAYVYNEEGLIVDAAGTEYALFHNLTKEESSLSNILRALKEGKPITILVSNAIYHNDSSKKGNHFVTLIGIGIGQTAIIMDGNRIVNHPEEAMVAIPFKKLLPGIKGAWVWEREFVERYL